MKYIGMAILALAAYLIASGYRAGLRRSLADAEAYASLLGYISTRVSEYLEPPGIWSVGYKTDNPSVREFLRLISSGESVARAFELSARESYLSPSVRDRLGELFASFGCDELQRERKNILEAESDLSELIDRQREAQRSSGRVALIAAFLISAGGVILIM